MADYINNSPNYSYDNVSGGSDSSGSGDTTQVLEKPHSSSTTVLGTLEFSWNGVESSTYGIIMLGPPTIISAKERYSSVKIPGRSGTVTTVEGEYIRDNITLSCNCIILKPDKIPNIAAWLSGYGTLAFGNRPNGYYKGRVSNQISFDKLLRGNSHRSFTIMFDCEPFFWMNHGDLVYEFQPMDASQLFPQVDGTGTSDPEQSEGGSSSKPQTEFDGGFYVKVLNYGNFYTEPLIRLVTYPTSPVSIPNDITIKVMDDHNNVVTETTVLYERLYRDNGNRRRTNCYIDSDSKMARSGTNVNMNGALRGDWPIFPADEKCYVVIETHVLSKIEITPRWRCLA